MMEDDGVPEYQSAISDLNECCRAGVRAFAKYYAKEWQISREQWLKSYAEPCPSDEYLKGFNAGCEAVEAACDSFLGEYHL